MNRRQFITLSGAASLATVTSTTIAADNASGDRDYYELRQYILETEAQKKGFDAFYKDAAIPAMNRAGIKPVGVLYPEKGMSPAYVLLRHKSIESFATLGARLAADAEFHTQGAAFINAPASAPAFKRMESSLMLAFKGMPQLETPVTSPGRIFHLRTYQSPSVKTGMKKIEMFNDAGEIKLFREVGMNPVFFGQTIVGTKMPNLTYMLVFKSAEDGKAAWGKFGSHPEWKRLKGMPEYEDKAILCDITDLPLVAADYAQV